ncbi:hypothetical protein AXG93_4085s1060 [Marchantia polymorpha subsp. ruderalis]|uniref:Reverse transcriptase Ty1/copia-type domain-containing protein n=1 Tax=Marchantia polymorpha subsp. ruderalis TaxID=1480154 RepID=A0A176WK06_MARPO|nr:hypothetical protein AXG93_4085s1060 [Marchantia polymorpha subsp. ruderalis]
MWSKFLSNKNYRSKLLLVSLLQQYETREIKRKRLLGDQRSSRELERLGVWTISSILKDRDLDFEDEDGMALILEEGELSSYREAQASVNKLEWNAAMEREMQSLINNKTWELVELPKDQTVIDSKWVYKLKWVYKMRQESSKLNWWRELFFRYLEEEIYMRQPIGFEVKGQERFNMADSKGVWTPLPAHFKLSAAQCTTYAMQKESMSCVPYEQAVDSLMYLMVCTRPDIALAMGKVMSYMSNPGKVH